MLITIVLALAIVLQLSAAFIALRLIPITGKRMAWGLIAAALTLMALRRCVIFYRLLAGDTTAAPDFGVEIITLAVSLLMVIGVSRIAPIFIAHDRAKKLLEMGTKEWETIFHAIGHAAFIINPDHSIVAANRAVLDATGMTEKEIVGRKCYEVFHPKTLSPPENCPMKKMLISGRMEACDMEADLGGTYDVTCTPVFDEKGRLQKVIHIATDITERKRSEARLKEAFDIISRSPAVAFLWRNAEGWPVEFVTDNVEALFGYKAEEFTSGKVSYAGTVHPDDLERVAKEVIDYSREKERIAFDHEPYRIVTRDGKVRWVNDSTLIRRDEKGGITHYQGILFDITDHKLTGDVLRESEEKFRKIFDGASDGILIAEPGTKRILQGNSAICSMLGYTKEEIESLTVYDIHPRNDISHVLDEFEKQFRGEKNLAEDVPLLKKDGSIIYADIGSVGITIGGKRSLVGIFRDITDHKKSQAALRESEARYRTLIETSRDLIYTTDRAGCLTYINPTLERFLGYERDELKGKPFTQMTVPEFSDTARDIFKRSMKGEQIPIYEAEFVRKDGTKVSVEINTTTLFDAEGKPSGRYGIGRDITERKKAEKERREYELRLASIIDFLPDATLVIDRGGKVIAWNRAIEQMTNVPASEMLGKGNHEYALPFYGERRPILIDLVLHPDREVQKKYSRIERKDLILYGENCIRNFRGGEVYLIGTASALRDSEGTVVGAIESIRDITERRTTEVMLRQSEERYKELFENMSSGVAVYEATDGGQDFIFRQFNKAGERIDNIKREALLGKKVTAVFPAIAEMGLLNVFQRVWRTGNPEHFPACVYEDGRISGWRENYVYRLPSGEIVAVYDDVTSRSKAEESLRKSEEKYRSIFENAQEGIYQATLEGSFITVNPALAQMTGYASPDEMMSEIRNIGRDLHLHPDDRARLTGIMEKEGFVSRFETTWKKKDGSVISVILNARAKKDDKGNIRYYDGTVVDVTGHKRLESQLLQAQKMEAVGTLAGGIAHDFNNLLMTMQGNTSMMLEELDLAHPHNEYLKSIESQIRSAANLTRQLLGFAREGRYDIKSMDINDVIEKAALIFGRTKKEIKIHRTYEKDLWLVEVDEDQMGQVFMNLFVNAWQAMPGGGDLFLQTSNVVLDEEYVVPYTLIPGEYVKVSITDTGVGMDEKTILRIFEPFFTTKERGKGTGLGLSMVYGIVKGHKGFINVYSKPGRGATFNIYLPASTKEVGPKAAISSGVIRGSGTILLIDDETNVLRVVQRMLDHLGYRTITAQSGKEAVDLYERRKEEIDLVLLDMIMPEMSGERVFQILREMNPRIRVILLSGYSINGQAKKIIDQGCRGFLQKPVSLAGLSQKINEVLVMKDEE